VRNAPPRHFAKPQQPSSGGTGTNFNPLRLLGFTLQEIGDLRIHRGRLLACELRVVVWGHLAEDSQLLSMTP
jgi:hypothetical protein